MISTLTYISPSSVVQFRTMCYFSYLVLPSLLLAFFVLISPAYPLSLTSPLLSSSIAIQGNVSTGASSVDCDAAKYGSNLRWSSVLIAVGKVSEDPAPLIFGMRGPVEEPSWNVILPHRIISGKQSM